MTELIQLPSGLVIPEASFGELVKARPELGEVATTRNGRDITRGYVDNLPILPPGDSVLAARGGSDYLIYDEVLRDDQVAAVLQQRRLAVVSREWEVLPGGKRDIDKKAAAFIEETLRHIRFDAVTDKMLFGLFYGFAVAECLWKRDGNRVMLDAIKVRDRRRFGYTPDGELVLRTTSNPNGEALPPNKFWQFSVGASHDDEPYGLGLAHWLYWPVLFKRNGIKFWMIFLEKFGMPTGVGKFPGNATQSERDKLLSAVHAIQADSGIIIPDGMSLELLEAARSGTADYTTLHDRMNAAISKVVVGQTMTTDSGSSRSQAEVHMDVRQDLVKADADLVCESANRSWVAWLTQWNFPGAKPPKIWRRLEDEPDLKPQAERDKIINDMGFKPKLEYIQATYGDGWEAKQPDNPQPGQPGGQAGDAAFADGDQDIPRQQRSQLEAKAARHVAGMVEAIRSLIDQVGDMQELEDRLLEAFPEVPSDDLVDLLAEGFMAAQLAGRYEVGDEQ